jgi:hypothetical protein
MEFPAVTSEVGRNPSRQFLQAFQEEIAAMLREGCRGYRR